MDKEFLENYGAREGEEYFKILQKLYDGKIERGWRYPPSNRLKLNEPYTVNIREQSLWNQLLPNIGTVVIELFPEKRKNEFEKIHGFKIEDIERLIDFAKETGKIQFCLGATPLTFKGMDFLESIFLDLQPPVMMQMDPTRAFFPIDGNGTVDYTRPAEKIKIWADEIFYFSEHSQFNGDCIHILEMTYPREKLEIVHYSHFLLHDYIKLRVLGYHELADEIILNLSNDPKMALFLLNFAKDFIIAPNFNLLGGIKSWKRNQFRFKRDFLKPYLSTKESCQTSQSMIFPIEIGKFLNDKLKLIIPENYKGVIEINDLYDEKDLKKLTHAIQKAIENEDLSGIGKNVDEIFTILNNTWNDVEHLKNYARIFRHGISLGIAAIGAVATLPIGGVGGLLAGLGFEVVEKIADIRAYEPVSEKIMRWSTPSHMIHVHGCSVKGGV